MFTDAHIARLLDIANAGCRRGAVTLARRIYTGILEERPAFVPACIGMAFSCIVLDEFTEAEAILRAVLEASPEDPDALAFLGLCLLLDRRRTEAEDVFARVPAGTPNSAFATALLTAQV